MMALCPMGGARKAALPPSLPSSSRWAGMQKCCWGLGATVDYKVEKQYARNNVVQQTLAHDYVKEKET